MRLILFSGGVESTAMMTIACQDDLALMVRPLPGDATTFKDGAAQSIAAHFGIPVLTAGADVPGGARAAFVHQMAAFIGLAHLMVLRNPAIQEVWCGRNSSEPSEEIRPFIERHMAAWDILHPKVPFRHPLDYMTKREQWAMIPKPVRHLVSSCVYHNFCGMCHKCREWLQLSETSPSAT